MRLLDMRNKLVIAAAGSGKTTLLVKEALAVEKSRVLITTFTEANELGIRERIIKENKFIPENITIQTWFSFLLQHGARPYQGNVFEKDITGLLLVNEGSAKGIAESDTERHYFTNSGKIYSDKLAKFVIKCNEMNDGEIIKRLTRIYSHIFIDEVQDLAGYDLELLKIFLKSNANIILVGDPRQGTYSTNNSAKNKKYQKEKIIHFFEDEISDVVKDDTSLIVNYRSVESICALSNKLYPHYKPTASANADIVEHSGVFFVKEKDVASYLQKYRPTQLIYSRRTKVSEGYEVTTFGSSKGLEFDRVIIYPTKDIINWLKDNNLDLASITRSKLYVALTRARHSAAIICNDHVEIDGIQMYVA